MWPMDQAHIDVITDEGLLKGGGDVTDGHLKNGDVITTNGRPASVPPAKSRPSEPFLVDTFRRDATLRQDSKQDSNSSVNGSTGKPLKRQRSTRSTRSTTSSARRRQNEDGCVTCLRTTLHCYNVFILLVGCAALGVGIWLLVTDFGARKVTPIVDNQMYEVTTYLLIAGGGAVALLAFCGCCGTIREDKCVLSFYGSTLAIVLTVLLVACGIAFVLREQLTHNIEGRMKITLRDHYGVEVRTSQENRRITDAWDAMQRQLKCCGVKGNVTSTDSWKIYTSSSQWNKYRQHWTTNRFVPDSCCVPGGDIKVCIGDSDFEGPPFWYRTEGKSQHNPHLYGDGCLDALLSYLRTYTVVVGAVAAGVPVFLAFGIVISFCLCARVQGYGTDDEVDL